MIGWKYMKLVVQQAVHSETDFEDKLRLDGLYSE